jgi:hypothetical protein
MIILSIGMPRAGSGWYYNLTNDLVLASGGQDARLIRQRYHLENILTEVNCNIGALTPRRLLAVLAPSLLGNTFVIKAHAAPSPMAISLIRRGMMRAAYLYRDPRDAMLSAMENGRRASERGRSNAFSAYAEFDPALKFMQDQLSVWDAWMGCPEALHTRYEDLLLEYDQQASRLADFLQVTVFRQEIRAIIDRYRPEMAQPDQRGIHFSHGKIGRFRQKMTAEQQETLLRTFGPYLERMGYPA